MMVDRRHFKNTLAGQLDTANLDDVRHRFRYIDDSDKNKDDRHPQSKRQSHHQSAQEHRAGVAHKYLCRMEVPHQKAQADTSQRCCQQVHLHKAFDGGNDQKAHGCHHCNRRCQPVDAIGQVDRIDRTDDDEQHDRVVEKADVKLPCKGNPQGGVWCKDVLRCQVEHCHQQLTQRLLPCF